MVNFCNINDGKDKVAIVVVGYNRYNSLERLLSSLESASYPTKDIPLIISIDRSNDEKVYALAQYFIWSHGEKYINIEKRRLGLVKHIYQCGDLTKIFRAIILLEDDLFVSPFFYYFVLQSLEKYGNESEISQIALYNNETNGYVGLPFPKYQDGSDVFLNKSVCTWGQCWNERMWNEFCSWRDSACSENIVRNQDMPAAIKSWTRAWSRYFNSYLVHQNKYVLFPVISLTTNFGDAGEHGKTNNSIVQVNLQQGNFNYRMPEKEKLVKYDIWGNNELLYEWLKLDKNEVCLDLFGFNKQYNKRYILSTQNLPFKLVKSFALCMRPIELNVKFNIEGIGIYLYDSNQSQVNKIDKSLFVEYFLKGFNISLLRRYIIKNILKKITSKFCIL